MYSVGTCQGSASIMVCLVPYAPRLLLEIINRRQPWSIQAALMSYCQYPVTMAIIGWGKETDRRVSFDRQAQGLITKESSWKNLFAGMSLFNYGLLRVAFHSDPAV
ncbi:hypothetical protein VTO42DRAFT_8863 [Malbranchea cinnamomea]